jgi:hypothetical protein
MEALGEATAAGAGAVISTISLYPVNKVKIRMQVGAILYPFRHPLLRISELNKVAKVEPFCGVLECQLQAERKQGGEARSSFVSLSKKMLAEEGWWGFYVGCTAAASKGFVNNFVFYYAFATLRRLVFSKGKSRCQHFASNDIPGRYRG